MQFTHFLMNLYTIQQMQLIININDGLAVLCHINFVAFSLEQWA